MSGKVLVSLESDDNSRCVDVFVRTDGSFGFEEFRSEFDGDGRWQPLNKHASLSSGCVEAALEEAKQRVAWLGGSRASSSEK